MRTFPSLCPSATAFIPTPSAFDFIASSIRTDAPSTFPELRASRSSGQEPYLTSSTFTFSLLASSSASSNTASECVMGRYAIFTVSSAFAPPAALALALPTLEFPHPDSVSTVPISNVNNKCFFIITILHYNVFSPTGSIGNFILIE